MRKLITLIIIIFFTEISLGSLPQIKIYNKQKDLINGRLEGISISSEGELFLAPAVKQIFNSERLFIWDFVADKTGNLFVATGDGAKIFQINVDNQVNMIAHWEDVEVYSLATDNNGILYAATSPEGKIYRFYPNKTPELFAKLNVKYIWDMLFDEQNNCYVATGDSGAIYIINPKRDVSVFYQSDETHIRCLAWDRNHQLLAGSYQNGYLYRISREGQAFVVYDSEFQEIHQICVTIDGTIYAAGLGQKEAERISTQDKETGIASQTSIKTTNILSVSPKPVESPKISTSGIIKIQTNGVIKNIWKQKNDQVQAIALAEDQALLVGTGNKGRLFKIYPHEESTYLLNFDSSQIVSFIPSVAGKIWIATSNLGKIYQLEPQFETEGCYESEVFNANTLSHWGSIQWDEQLPSGCSVKLYTRSGNTGKPNSTWSSWSTLNKDKIIKSPGARFIQWKLELTTKHISVSPKIKNIKISYLQQNLPPEILSINIQAVARKAELRPVTPQDQATLGIKSRDEVTSSPQKQIPQSSQILPIRNGYLRVMWKAEDKNNDQLIYSLFFQQKNEENWWVLKKDLSRTLYTWDSRMMPDGHYRIKVIANDSKSNPINTAKQSEKIGDWFIIDNTGPRIEKSKIEKIENDSLQISFQVVDEFRPIKQVQISYNTQKWLWVYPQDLVCDSKKEEYQFNVQLNQNQFRSIIIKAIDEADNIGYSQINIKE